jgi:hypothetical protein
MEYEVSHSHRFGYELFQVKENFQRLWSEIDHAIQSVTDEELVEGFRTQQKNSHVQGKSISRVVNGLLRTRFISLGWNHESRLFQDEAFGDAWALDYAKDHVSVEVGFNHGTDAAWNVLKPNLASELNHIEKQVQTDLGVVITATPELKRAGGFDGAIGTSETYKKILVAMQQVVTVPIVIIGLRAPRKFAIAVQWHKNEDGKRKGVGEIVWKTDELKFSG